jgi:hypothetical protein
MSTAEQASGFAQTADERARRGGARARAQSEAGESAPLAERLQAYGVALGELAEVLSDELAERAS